MIKQWGCLLLLSCIVIAVSSYPGLTKKVPEQETPKVSNDSLPLSATEKGPSILDWAGIANDTIDQHFNQSKLSFEPISNGIFYFPYFIFQATYGEKASDFYLFSLNTQTGELVKIHKGFHGAFLIKGNQLLFRHTDHFFTCTIPNWQQLYEKKSLQTWKDFVSSKGNLQDNKTEAYLSFSCELPPPLRLIDWEYVYCVKEGSFTKPEQKEILFISGRKPAYDIAVYTWVNNKMRVVENLGTKSGNKEWLTVSSKNDESMMSFRQAIFEDVDKDRCQEIFINSVYAAWIYEADPLLFLDFSQPAGRKRFLTLDTQSLNDTEILRADSGLILIGDTFKVNERELVVYRIDFQQNTKQARLALLNPIPTDLKRKIKTLSHQRFNDGLFFGPLRKHLSFARTGRNLSDAGNPKEMRSKLWSKLPICSLYNANNPDLTPREKQYHTKRNEFLQQWVAKLDTGWNPFSGYTFSEDKSYFVDMNHSWKLLKQVVEVIPVFEQNRIFPVLVAVMKNEDRAEESSFDKTVLLLYNEVFTLQDLQIVEVNTSMHSLADLNLPLPRENILFASYSLAPRYAGRHAFVIYPNRIEETLKISYNARSNVFLDQNRFLVHISMKKHYYGTNWGDGGNGVGFYFDYIIDPVTNEIMDTQFPDYFRFKLDYLYYKYHFFHYRGTSDLVPESGESVIISFLERYEKNIYYHELTPMSEEKKQTYD